MKMAFLIATGLVLIAISIILTVRAVIGI